MRRSLFPSDDELPTWLHTLLLTLVVTPFAGFLFWFGIGAIFGGFLEPLSGAAAGQFFFGDAPLYGVVARIAGLSLIVLGAAFFAIVFRFSRFTDGSGYSRWLPWTLLMLSIHLSILVKLLTVLILTVYR